VNVADRYYGQGPRLEEVGESCYRLTTFDSERHIAVRVVLTRREAIAAFPDFVRSLDTLRLGHPPRKRWWHR
jgi:hypothetical protein